MCKICLWNGAMDPSWTCDFYYNADFCINVISVIILTHLKLKMINILNGQWNLSVSSLNVWVSIDMHFMIQIQRSRIPLCTPLSDWLLGSDATDSVSRYWYCAAIFRSRLGGDVAGDHSHRKCGFFSNWPSIDHRNEVISTDCSPSLPQNRLEARQILKYFLLSPTVLLVLPVCVFGDHLNGSLSSFLTLRSDSSGLSLKACSHWCTRKMTVSSAHSVLLRQHNPIEMHCEFDVDASEKDLSPGPGCGWLPVLTGNNSFHEGRQ